MDALVVATLAFALGAVVGLIGGLWFAARQFGRQIRADMTAGRLSREDAQRLVELPDARR